MKFKALLTTNVITKNKIYSGHPHLFKDIYAIEGDDKFSVLSINAAGEEYDGTKLFEPINENDN